MTLADGAVSTARRSRAILARISWTMPMPALMTMMAPNRPSFHDPKTITATKRTPRIRLNQVKTLRADDVPDGAAARAGSGVGLAGGDPLADLGGGEAGQGRGALSGLEPSPTAPVLGRSGRPARCGRPRAR